MDDPYRILGVSPTSSDEEIKKAYRELARKYHPDNFGGGSSAESAEAERRMKEINAAYDDIQNERSGKGRSSDGGASYGYRSSSARPEYRTVRLHINSNRLDEAERILSSMLERDAEWYFLMGSVYYKKGWFDECRGMFETACNMDPRNLEYRAALNRVMGSGTAYRQPRYSGSSGGGCSGCDICSSLICADCCCECMGGDLIPCC